MANPTVGRFGCSGAGFEGVGDEEIFIWCHVRRCSGIKDPAGGFVLGSWGTHLKCGSIGRGFLRFGLSDLLSLLFLVLGIVGLKLSALIPGMPLGTHFSLSAPGAVLLLIAWCFRRVVARLLHAVGCFTVSSHGSVCAQVE